MKEIKQIFKENFLIPKYSLLSILIACQLGFTIRGSKIDYIINLILYMWSIRYDLKRYRNEE